MLTRRVVRRLALVAAAALLAAGVVTASALAWSPDNAVRDNFNRADGSLGANWAGVVYSGQCGSNTIASQAVASCASTSASSGSSVFQTSYGADQEAYVTVTTVGSNASGTLNGVMLRWGGTTGYRCGVTGSGVWRIDRVNAGSATLLASSSDSLSNGDKIGCFVSGSYVELDRFIAASSQWVPETAVRDPHGIGGGGFIGLVAAFQATLDDFGGGVSTSAQPPQAGYVNPATTVTTTVQSTVTVTTGGGTGTTAIGSNCGGTTTDAGGATVAQVPCTVDIGSGGTAAAFLNNIHDDIFVVVGATLGAALIVLMAEWFLTKRPL
jgi:hypothetical protein